MNRSMLPFAGVLLATLAGCAAPLAKLGAPMDEASKADHVVILLEQTEIRVDDADVNGGAFGVIGVLVEAAVESAKTKNRQQAIAPLRDALLEYRFEDKLVQAIQEQLPTSLVKAGAPVKVVRSTDEWRNHVRGLQLPANVFVVTTRYGLEQDFQIAYIHAMASLLAVKHKPLTEAEMHGMRSEERKAREPKALHMGSYYSEHVMQPMWGKKPDTGKQPRYEFNAAQWAVEDARPVRDAFGRGAGEIASLVRLDGDGGVQASGAKSKALVANWMLAPMAVKAPVAERADDRLLLADGMNLRWVDARQIKQ
jgi:hypothetical protein